MASAHTNYVEPWAALAEPQPVRLVVDALTLLSSTPRRDAVQINRVHADRYVAYLGFALSFLFLLAVVALAFNITNGVNDVPPSSIARTAAK